MKEWAVEPFRTCHAGRGAAEGPRSRPGSWDFSSLLERTCRFDRLYEPPGHWAGMASSYDRSLANADSRGFIREENGRYLMADIPGPGAVVRIWSADPAGQLWVHLDGEERPTIRAEFLRLFLGDWPPFVEPFAHAQKKDDVRCYHWSYVPIPFARSCRVYRDRLSFFQATFVRFPSGTAVEPLSLPLAARHEETLRRLAGESRASGQRPPSVCGEQRLVRTRVPPRTTGTLAVVAGPAVLRGLRLRWPEMDRQAGRTALLTAAWDGEPKPSIRVPLSDFFGSGFRSLVLGTGPDGMGYCYFPMPFRRSAALSIENEGREPLDVSGELIIDREENPASPLRTFHASWRRDLETRPVPVRAREQVTNPVCDPSHNHLVADIRGRGHYVATLQHRYGRSEGDEFVLVDGERPPGSSPGTGNEDYFNMAWGPKTMDSPLAAGISVLGVAECFRAHLPDAVAFDRSLHFSFEVFCANTARYDYDSTAFWYQEEPHAPFPGLLPAAARRFRTLDRPPEPEYAYAPDPEAPDWWQGVPSLPVEGEDLEVLSFEGARPLRADMLEEGPDWSGGAQLLQASGPEGGSAVLRLPPVETDGWHMLRIRWTTGPEYGRVRLHSDLPHRLGAADCNAPQRGAQVCCMGSILRRRADGGSLRIETKPSVPAAPSAWMGMDWLEQSPGPHPIGAADVSGPRECPGGSGIDAATAWRPCPHLALPTPEEIEAARAHRKTLPPAEALAPADPQAPGEREFILRAQVHAAIAGLYRVDWRGPARPPSALTVNGMEHPIDPRRFAAPWNGELPRRFLVEMKAGDNTFVWRASYGPGQWVAPVVGGVQPPSLP